MADRVKANGIHYTPTKLAAFLARETRKHFEQKKGPIRVLDPACGGGALLAAFVESLPVRTRRRVVLTGYETDSEALQDAQLLLQDLGARELLLSNSDFLTHEGAESDLPLFERPHAEGGDFDVVIANPPYVRTQVLGASQAQSLARKFGLSGRVDLYHAFVVAMTNRLRPGGVLGLLTSNRFLTIRSGESLRFYLRDKFDLQAVYDLGDTKLFSAAVLPAILVATRKNTKCSPRDRTEFCRVYEAQPDSVGPSTHRDVIEVLHDSKASGLIRTDAGTYKVERGILASSVDAKAIWSLSTPGSVAWLSKVRKAAACTIHDVATVRVGIKTTADKVFVRSDWSDLPSRQRPEKVLLRKLLTHREAGRWLASKSPTKRVLYPHILENGKRTPIELADYPLAKAYLEANGDRLRSRKYVIEGGRRWYEIWVPHSPLDWQRKKIVFPDISEEPRFFFDPGKSIVQGDCYWITTKPGFHEDWLWIILAVCNSSFITRYYDTVFHNKLYSGRRRFMTQYVKTFPLPDSNSKIGGQLIEEARKLASAGPTDAREESINSLVWKSFGLTEEGIRQRDL